MAWKTMDVHEQRVRFVIAATQKAQPFRALCAAYEISRPTGYLWLQRYQALGIEGIAEQSRKPHHSPRRTASELERQVVQVRLRYPDWGARKLQVLLAREGVALPRNTIHRILLRHDLVREEERRAPAVQRFERGQPNELWQMDFKGPKGWPQAVGPLSVLDDHSRYLIALAANGSTQGEPVREQLPPPCVLRTRGSVKDVPGQCVKDVMRLNSTLGRVGAEMSAQRDNRYPLFHHIFLVPPSQTLNRNPAKILRQCNIEKCARLPGDATPSDP